MIVLTLPRSLPSPEDFELLISKYKAFRLLSLKLSPESFGSTHAREIAFPDDKWTSRISNPLATNLVGVSDAHACPENSTLILNHEWLGSLTLIGPVDKDVAAQTFTDLYLKPEIILEGEAKWRFALNAMYVLPSARGMGLGGELVKSAKKVASELVSGERASILLVVDYDNEGARKTYEKNGFEIIERHWFDDYRVGRAARTEAAVMRVDVN